MKRIAVASDHGGFELKQKVVEYLKSKGFHVQDFGTNSSDSCDYPVFANKVCSEILNKNFERGILICGTGIGMSIAANRHKGIRAACLSDKFSVEMTRKHNDSNVLCLGARVLEEKFALELIDIWLNTEFEAGRHSNRINMLDL